MARRNVHKQHRSLLVADSANNKWATVPDSLPAFRIYGPSVKRVLIKRKVETTLGEEYSNGLKNSNKEFWEALMTHTSLERVYRSTRRQPNLYIID